jgi:hypothetical protein
VYYVGNRVPFGTKPGKINPGDERIPINPTSNIYSKKVELGRPLSLNICFKVFFGNIS